MMVRLKNAADAEGLPWGTRKMTYNSRLAQELGKWAEEKGRGDEVGQVKANGDPVPILGARPGKSRAVSGSRGRGKNAKKR